MSSVIWRQFNPTKGFELLKMLSFHGFTVDGGGEYSYTVTAPIVNQSSLEYTNNITWTDGRPKPTFSDLQGFFSSYVNTYSGLQTDMDHLHDLYDNYLAKSSHTHAQSDITSLSSALSLKVNGKAGMYLHEAQATTDSSSVVIFHLTSDGTSSGTALFSGVPKVVANGKDSTGTPITSPQVAELAWSNSNKTVTFKASKATTLLALGNTAINTGAGVVVDLIAYGAKA